MLYNKWNEERDFYELHDKLKWFSIDELKGVFNFQELTK